MRSFAKRAWAGVLAGVRSRMGARARARALAKALMAVAVVALAVSGALWMAGWWGASPGLSRDWADDHSMAPSATFDGDHVTVSGVRSFEFRSADDFTPRYDQRTYDLRDLDSVWYVVTPFQEDGGTAHTFLSFGFGDSTYVAISVEARRETGESYSLLGGLIRRYEVIYVVGDERDLIGVRAVHRGNLVRLYPIRAEPGAIRALFVGMLERANALEERPEFYNTLTNNCMTNILRHVNTLVDPPIRYGPRILLPGYSDAIALRRGLIDTDLTIEEARERYEITERAVRYADSSDFSIRIRETGAVQ